MKWYGDSIYIKMCEQAKKIQKEWKPQKGDFVFTKHQFYPNENYRVLLITEETGPYEFTLDNRIIIQTTNKASVIWLPSQEQLQEMVGHMGMRSIMKKAYRRFGSLEISNPKLSDTPMEQLWLAFVMKEKYNKTWNGENWICINKQY